MEYQYTDDFIEQANVLAVKDALLDNTAHSFYNTIQVYNDYAETNGYEQIYQSLDDCLDVNPDLKDTKYGLDGVKDENDYIVISNGRAFSFNSIDDFNCPIDVDKLAEYVIEENRQYLFNKIGYSEVNIDDEHEMLYYAVRQHLEDVDDEEYRQILEKTLNVKFNDPSPETLDTLLGTLKPSEVIAQTKNLSFDINKPVDCMDYLIYMENGQLKEVRSDLQRRNDFNKSNITVQIIEKTESFLHEIGFNMNNYVKQEKSNSLKI